MRNEFTAVIERDGDWYVSYCLEVPGANGQGRTVEESKRSLAEAVALILEDRREDMGRDVPSGAIREVIHGRWPGISVQLYRRGWDCHLCLQPGVGDTGRFHRHCW